MYRSRLLYTLSAFKQAATPPKCKVSRAIPCTALHGASFDGISPSPPPPFELDFAPESSFKGAIPQLLARMSCTVHTYICARNFGLIPIREENFAISNFNLKNTHGPFLNHKKLLYSMYVYICTDTATQRRSLM